ncbi:RNA polymerase II transcription factor B subunit 4 [Fimicolochytrium jonesii]|uniref:RNA polymerase II transcription factor B subunit 4 n=1 Tax=Fimicolochytrium jonesii TaxID=1396493 RepID=UPI0022FF0A51|nr:RNA polymerase II transcription factor B subunit 4 [Fimicolochytrium jonesii]KAI8816065.1 RNA polymerase II transcription factor B subunit 4 [Fimicolochytrium jonesii]
MTTDEDINLLVLIIDTNPHAWATAANDPDQPISFVDVLEHILIFINAHLSLRFDSKLAIIASHSDTSRFLFPAPENDATGKQEADEAKKPANTYKQFFDVNQRLVKEIKGMVRDDQNTRLENRTMTAGSLSLAQTYINRVRRENEGASIQSRILLVSISPDLPSQYIPTMNCIFAAQRLGTRIDVCRFGGRHYGSESVFLPQASHITGGTYLDVPEPRNLLQYLLYTFLPEPSIRNVLLLPSKEQLDFRAACFCHKKVVDVGHVCSVCLSIFCSTHDVCPTCQTKFPT